MNVSSTNGLDDLPLTPQHGALSSHLETLLIELTHLVFGYLPFEDILAIKFTSSSMLALTERADGTNLFPAEDKQEHCLALAKLEAKRSHWSSTTVLTCSKCGMLKPNDLNGFSNPHFKRLREDRRCLDCLAQDNDSVTCFHHVGDIWAFWCTCCRTTKNFEEALHDGNLGELMSKQMIHAVMDKCKVFPFRYSFERRVCKGCFRHGVAMLREEKGEAFMTHSTAEGVAFVTGLALEVC